MSLVPARVNGAATIAHDSTVLGFTDCQLCSGAWRMPSDVDHRWACW